MSDAKELTLEDFKPGDRVRYVPYHARGDRNHTDCQDGIVSSVGHAYVFVKFTREIAQACKPDQLVVLTTAEQRLERLERFVNVLVDNLQRYADTCNDGTHTPCDVLHAILRAARYAREEADI
jgi:hypothetical protein